MRFYRFELKAVSPFASLIKGDTLFGQMCLAILEKFGEGKLEQFLSDYENSPKLICSDAFSTGYLPKPIVPSEVWDISNEDRKIFKQKKWVKKSEVVKPIKNWCCENIEFVSKTFISRNHIDQEVSRSTGGEFSNFLSEIYFYHTNMDIYLSFDETFLSENELKDLISYIGTFGYGKSISSGYGKFDVLTCENVGEFALENANAYMTLSPCVPQIDYFDVEKTYYKTCVKFGKHGNSANKSPFKTPILMSDTAGVFTPKKFEKKTYIGKAIKGISKMNEKTVHQGYSLVVPVIL